MLPPSRSLFLLLLTMLAVLALPAQDQETPVIPAEVTVAVVSSDLAVGDACVLEVLYRWPLDAEVIRAPRPEVDLARLHVLEVQSNDPVTVDQHMQQSWRVTCLVPRSGAWVLPQPHFIIATATGEPQRIEAEVVVLQIGETTEEPVLEPLEPLWERPAIEAQTSLWWLWTGLGLVTAAGVGLWLLLLRKRDVQVLTPIEVFSQDIVQALRQDGDAKQAGSVISVALRRYCGDSYNFDGVGATADEALRHLQEHLLQGDWQDLRQVFRSIDDLRWSPGELEASAVQPYVDQARTIVQRIEERLVVLRAAEAEAKRG